MKIVFVIGGARSGKSAFALKEASTLKGRKAYIATAQALDEEMQERIRKHKDERGTDWDTYEEPVKITETLKELNSKYDVIVLDCLTLWLSNVLLCNLDVKREIENLAEALKRLSPVTCGLSLFIVSNEVGMGIVPENEMARRFRDLAGLLNQKVAGPADEVYLVTAGIPVKIKGVRT